MDDAESTMTGMTAAAAVYDSDGRVPPWIDVQIQPQAADCSAASTGGPVRRYPWQFYILHVMAGEIRGTGFPGGAFDEAATRSVMSAAQNFAWYHRQRSTASGDADVTNTTQFQCFKPQRPVRRAWRNWVADILNERVVENGAIQLTQYRAGTYNCTESGTHASNGNVLSQLGAKARDETCGVNDWRNLVEYYFTGVVTSGVIPPRPTTSHAPVNGGIDFSFPSRVGGSSVGWRYHIERNSGSGWVRIHNRGWSWRSRSISTTVRYSTSTSARYRARACNPVGCSEYSSFNNGNPISPNMPGG